MSINTGTLITAAIRPNDSLDPIASAFANEIKGGHHGYATLAERNGVILERREWGMFVTVYNDSNPLNNGTYQLTYGYVDNTITNNANWQLFSSGNFGATGATGSIGPTGPGLIGATGPMGLIKYVITSGENIIVPTYSQYWVYGDLTIYGELTNYGEVVIADGSLVLMGGSFSNFNSLSFVSINPSLTYSFVNTSTIAFTQSGGTVSAYVISGSLTASYLNSTGYATASYILSVDGSGVFEWIPAIGTGTITGVNAGAGLTGGGFSGTVTIDVVTGNGISIGNDSIILGGTLSQDTTIDGQTSLYGISFNNISEFNATTSFGVININSLDEFKLNSIGNTMYLYTTGGDLFVDSASGSVTTNVYGGNNSIFRTSAGITYSMTLNSLGSSVTTDVTNGQFLFRTSDSQALMQVLDTGSISNIYLTNYDAFVSDGSLNNRMVVTDGYYNKGLIYADNYSANFTNNSLVSKFYVDNAISMASSVTASNGLTYSSGVLILGGILDQNTLIKGSQYSFQMGDIGSELNGFTIYATNSSNISLYAGSIGDGTYSMIRNSQLFGLQLLYQRGGAGGGNTVFVDANSTYMGTVFGSSQSYITTVFNAYPISNNGSNNYMYVSDDLGNKGLVYISDYSSNFTPESLITKRYVDNKISGSASKLSINDKNIIAYDTLGDGQWTGATISGNPIDNSYVTVYVNGVEFDVGNGITSSVSCYFSNDGGTNARGFSSLHPNGKIQTNDRLYWNGVYTGVDLTSGWRISIHYLI